MAAKDKTSAEKPAKKRQYKKPTADKISDKDLAGVSGGGGLERRACASGWSFHGPCSYGDRPAREKCIEGGQQYAKRKTELME